MMGPRESSTCANNLTVITNICSKLGIPLALAKVEGLSHCLIFLGITLDAKLMQAHLLKDKLKRIQRQVADWLPHKKATKREMLSLVGLLEHAIKVAVPGRTFVSRMYRAAARLKRFSHFT